MSDPGYFRGQLQQQYLQRLGAGAMQPGNPVWPPPAQQPQQQQEPFGCFFSCGFLFSCIRQTNDFGMRQPGGPQQQPVGWPQQQQPQQQQPVGWPQQQQPQQQ